MKPFAAALLLVLLAVAPAQAWTCESLIGVWAPHGDTLLGKRGYNSIWRIKATTYWWNISHRKCVQVVEAQDRYVDVKNVPEEVCTMPWMWQDRV